MTSLFSVPWAHVDPLTATIGLAAVIMVLMVLCWMSVQKQR